MGCLVGVFATVVAAGFGWLAHFFGAPVGLIAIVVAATLGLFALPVIKYGHVEFRGGGRIDFMLYVLVVGIVAAVAVPRFVSPVACSRVQRHLEWVRTAESDFHSVNGYYTDDVAALVAHVEVERSFDFHPDVVIKISSVAESTFVASAVHPRCVADGDLRELSIDQTSVPQR